MSGPIAGWYPDPAGDTTKIRYWDGASWTDRYREHPRPDQLNQAKQDSSPVMSSAAAAESLPKMSDNLVSEVQVSQSNAPGDLSTVSAANLPNESTNAPTASTNMPSASTNLLNVSTNAPSASTGVPTASSNSQASSTQSPTASTDRPTALTNSDPLPQVSQGCGPEAISAVIAAPLPTILANPAQVVDPTASRADRMAVASLVLGILSVSSYCLIIWLILNYTFSILAIVFGIKGRRGSRKGIASAGLVFGIIGLAIAIGIHVLVVMEALGYRDIPGLDITLPF